MYLESGLFTSRQKEQGLIFRTLFTSYVCVCVCVCVHPSLMQLWISILHILTDVCETPYELHQIGIILVYCVHHKNTNMVAVRISDVITPLGSFCMRS